MGLLGIGLFAGLVTIVLTIARDAAFKKWEIDREIDEAMEFFSFSAKPHPIYPKHYLLWIGLALVVAAFAALLLLDSLQLVVGLLVIGMVIFLFYDFSGAAVKTNITILKDGLLFESAVRDIPRIFMPYENIESISKTATGFNLELHRPKLCNKMPIKCSSKDDIIERIQERLNAR
jgi:hypothetical protein